MARGRRRAVAAAGEPKRPAPAEPKPPPSPAAAPAGRAAAAPLPDAAELLAAIETLYRDQLRPYGRILKKRLAERAAGDALEASDSMGCDAAELRAMCEASEHLIVLPEEGGEWSALLVGRPEEFVDIYDQRDDYPEALWSAAEDYFKGLGRGGAEPLPGGRYTSAVALAARRLPFLDAYSLGQVCHIMQIAIAQRKLLGYFNGAIVPYDCSTSMMKSRCAREQRPLATSTTASTPEGTPLVVVDWETARAKLREILGSAIERGSDQVPLSNVKRLFRSLYQMELSETALGHSKLTELLQDPKFSDVCTVQLKDRGYVVVPASLASGGGGASGSGAGVAQAAAPSQTSPRQDREDVGEAEGQSRSVSGGTPGAGDASTKGLSPLTWPMSPSQPSTARRTRSLPKDLGSSRGVQEPLLSPFGGVSVNSADGEAVTLADSAPEAGEPEQERVRFCIDEPLCLEEAGLGSLTGHSPAYPLMTPSPSYDHASQPLGKGAWEATCRALGLVPWPEEVASPEGEAEQKGAASPEGRRAKFCPGEPLCLDEGDLLSTPSRDPALPYPVMTPSPQYRDCIAFQASGRWGLSDLDKCAQ